MPLSSPPDLSALLEALPLGAYVFRLEDRDRDESLRIVFANSASEQMLGFAPSKVVGTLIGEHFANALGESGIATAYRTAILDQTPCDLGIVSYGDEELAQQRFAATIYPVGLETGVALFENLSSGPWRSNELAAIVDSAEDAILSKDMQGTILTWNRAAERIYGYSPSEAIGKSISMLEPPERPNETTTILDRLRAGDRIEQVETTRLRKDGSVVAVSLTVSPLADLQGTVVGAATIAREIGQRKENEAHLRRYAGIVEASEDAIVSRTLDGVITTWNGGAERLFGYTADEMIGVSLDAVAPDTPFEGGGPSLDALRAQLRNGDHPKPFETRMRRKDGTHVDVSVATSPIADAWGHVIGAAAVIRDMTEQRLLEMQLRQSQKLEAIGALAGGIAHDFNNVLTIIRATADTVLGELDDEPQRQRIKQIDLAAEHAASLTHQLLAFSRQQILRPSPTDLNEVVGTTLDLVTNVIGEHIDVKTQLGSDLSLLHVDPVQLQQVILNLCLNARDAMPDGGTITIRTSNAHLDERYAATHLDVIPGPYAELEITDSGTGMDRETADRIFDPFFTTKSDGNGLGLATVHGIIKQSGGHLWLYTEPGFGTTFKIYLPHSRSGSFDLEPVPAENGSVGGAETILVVEDNPMLRPLIAEMLEPHGYTVLLAGDGVEALDVVAAHPGTIDLLLTDVVMPRLNGQELSEQLVAKNPGTRVLFTSGYPADVVVPTSAADAQVEFIQKPYITDELLSKIRSVLGSSL